MEELKRNLQKISGTDASLTSDNTADSSSQDLYPSIRRLPLLGVQWADLYRRAKVQESVYQLLDRGSDERNENSGSQGNSHDSSDRSGQPA